MSSLSLRGIAATGRDVIEVKKFRVPRRAPPKLIKFIPEPKLTARPAQFPRNWFDLLQIAFDNLSTEVFRLWLRYEMVTSLGKIKSSGKPTLLATLK